MKAKDWTLLAIAVAEGKPLSPVQLQKSLFLLGRECPKVVGKNFYHFTPYNYGPFDVTVYHDAEGLALDQLITIHRAPGQSWSEYRVSPHGLKAASKLRKNAPKEAVDYLDRVVAWVRSLSFAQLVRAIYHHYPEYRANSVFQD